MKVCFSLEEVLLEFAELRLAYYDKRKAYHVDRLKREKELLDAKVKFILLVVKGELKVTESHSDQNDYRPT
eukprot:5309016-Amphidinium_carterae.1